MTENPKYLKPTDPIQEAAQLMRDEDVGSILVCDEQNKKLIDILTITMPKSEEAKKGIKKIGTRSLIIEALPAARTKRAVGGLMKFPHTHSNR